MTTLFTPQCVTYIEMRLSTWLPHRYQRWTLSLTALKAASHGTAKAWKIFLSMAEMDLLLIMAGSKAAQQSAFSAFFSFFKFQHPFINIIEMHFTNGLWAHNLKLVKVNFVPAWKIKDWIRPQFWTCHDSWCCRGMCKIVTWLDDQNKNGSKIDINKI